MKIDLRGLHGNVAVLLLAGGLASEAPAQLAITEVMAQPIRSCLTPDYWELTNYGNDPIDLHGYTFTDKDGKGQDTTDPFANLVIQGGKSVVFMRSNSLELTTQYFTNWWGSNLGPMLQEIRLYDGPGLSGSGDIICLKDADGSLVYTASFGPSSDGRSFVPDANSGLLIDYATPGVNAAFRSATCTNDIGSPGHSPPAIPVSIRDGQPVDQEVDASSDVTFAVEAAGLPLPQFQWLYQGIPLPDANASSLTLTNVQPDRAGTYQVVVSNAFGQVVSRQATLDVRTNCACARIVNGPADSIIYDGQTGLFTARARGYPAPRFQWSTNGVEVPGATGDTFELNAVTLSMSGVQCSVRVWNEPTAQCPISCPATNASAVLTVTRWPRLQITEVMADPFPDAAFLHDDWFEVSNDDTFEVDLYGYRFNNPTTSAASFINAFRITNSLVLHPGESVIFVKERSAEQFGDWWGRELLPPNLKIYTFRGFSLSPSGEAISLWNAGARSSSDVPVAACDFGSSLNGFTFEFSHDCYDEQGCTTSSATKSVAGANGAFRAADGGDTGSPGYRTNPRPRLLNLHRDGASATVRCRVTEGRTYRLYAKDALANPVWSFVGENVVADDFVITILDPSASGAVTRFYRLEEAP